MDYRLRVSSSVAPFREKAEKIWGLERYRWPRDMFKPVVFFGMYHLGDYFRYLRHLGPNEIFWCGYDIVNFKKWPNRILKFWFRNISNYVENEVEQEELKSFGIESEVRPSFLEDVNDFPVCFKPSDKPQVFLTTHSGREEEYGVLFIASIARKLPHIIFHIYGISSPNLHNIIFHGRVPPEQFNEEIKNYQAGLRLNEHDGNSEITMKSVLCGGYPITKIKYPFIDNYENEEELIKLLKELKNKKEPNYKGREHYIQVLNDYPWMK